MSSFPGEGATDTHMSYLRQELQRLVFDEDCRRKAFNESRIALQEVWDKLVNIRSHISDIRAEVENVRIEAITTSFEGMLWHGDADDQSSKLSLQSASRVAEARHMRDKVRLKEALQAKILAVEEQISGRKQQMLHLSQALKDSAQDLDFHGGRSLAASTLGARSLEIRSQLLSVSKNLNDMEVQLSEFKSEMQRLQQELTQFLQGQQPRKSSTQMPSAQERAAGDWANKKAAYDEIMIELVANGRPFTADLVDELLRHCYALESAEESKADVTWHHAKPQMECSVDEVISSQTQIVRMNGEAPQQYISRLEKRLSTLEYFEVETAQEFQRAVVAVKRFRDLVSCVIIIWNKPLLILLLKP